MPCFSDLNSINETTNFPFANWSGRFQGNTSRKTTPNSLKELVAIVVRATRSGQSVRAVGSGWSFSDIAFSQDCMVSLDNLAKPLENVVPSALRPEWKANSTARKLIHVEAGIKLAALNEKLASRGLALPTLGGYNAQSISGVISTGTHGGALAVPPFPEIVRAIHLVTHGGREIWLERASEPITLDGPLAQTIECPEAEVIRDDNLFDSVICSMGRFGIFYSLILEVVPAFRLVEQTVDFSRVRLCELLQDGISSSTLLRPLLQELPTLLPPLAVGPTEPYGLEVVMSSRNLNNCFVTRRWHTSSTVDINVSVNEYGLYEYCTPEGRTRLVSDLTAALDFFKFLASTAQLAAIEKAKNDMAALSASNNAQKFGLIAGVATDCLMEINHGGAVDSKANEQFVKRFENSRGHGRCGPSHVIISRPSELSSDANMCQRADSIEFIFDATQRSFIDFLNFIAVRAPNVRQAGYVALNWSPRSRAKLSMHNLNNAASSMAVAVEVTSLLGMSGNEAWFRELETLAIALGGRPHWGQINTLDETKIKILFGENYAVWRERLGALTGNSKLFSNDYTKQRSLEPTLGTSELSIRGNKVGAIRGQFEAVQAAIDYLLG